MCKYYHNEIEDWIKTRVVVVAGCIWLLTLTQFRSREVVRAHRCPIWLKCTLVQPFFTVALLFLGDHATDVYSAFIGADWCVFAVTICLLTGVVDDFSFMETFAGVTIQAIFIIHLKKVEAYSIIFAFSSVVLSIKQALSRFYVHHPPLLHLPAAAAAAADMLPAHRVDVPPEQTT